VLKMKKRMTIHSSMNRSMVKRFGIKKRIKSNIPMTQQEGLIYYNNQMRLWRLLI
jgi:hypothetical protein